MNKSRNSSSRAEHKNELFSTEFKAFKFWIFLYYMRFKIIFWREWVFMLYLYDIDTKYEKRISWIVSLNCEKKFWYLGKKTKSGNKNKLLLFCLGFIYTGCNKMIGIYFQLF